MFSAAEDGDLDELVRTVTSRNVNERDDASGTTLLMLAVSNGHVKVVEWLLSVMRADVNHPCDNATTPLVEAAMQNHEVFVKLLLGHGANPNMADVFGGVPCHFARVACLKMLLDANANVTLADADGRNALHFATQSRLEDVERCRLLVNAGCPIDSKDAAGRTPLYWALRNGQRDVAELLISVGALISNVKLDVDLVAIPFWAHFAVARCKARCDASFAVLGLARCGADLQGNGRDIIRLIARAVWQTRGAEPWRRFK